MQVTVEATAGLERRMRVIVPAEKLQSQVDAQIRATAGKAHLKGFRKGKVPVREIKRRFGKSILQEVSADIIQSTYSEAIEQESVRPAGRPRIEDIKIDEGQDLEYTAVFDIFPDVEIAHLDKIKVERPLAQVKKADIDRMIETLREQNITWRDVDRPSQKGDRLTVDYEGTILASDSIEESDAGEGQSSADAAGETTAGGDAGEGQSSADAAGETAAGGDAGEGQSSADAAGETAAGGDAGEGQPSADTAGAAKRKKLEGGQQENAQIVLGSGRMIKGFEEGLVKLTAGAETSLDLTFPKDYAAEQLQGKLVSFDIKVHAVAEPVKPDLNEEFFSKFGVAEGGMEAFRQEVKDNMEREMESIIRGKLKTQVLNGLAEQHEITLPQSLVDEEVRQLKRQAVANIMQAPGAELNPDALPSEPFIEKAANRVKTGLLVQQLVTQTGLKLDEERVRQQVETLASTYEQQEDVINFYYQHPEHLASVQNMVLEEQLVDYVLENAKVSNRRMSYDKAIKPLPEPGQEKSWKSMLKLEQIKQLILTTFQKCASLVTRRPASQA